MEFNVQNKGGRHVRKTNQEHSTNLFKNQFGRSTQCVLIMTLKLTEVTSNLMASRVWQLISRKYYSVAVFCLLLSIKSKERLWVLIVSSLRLNSILIAKTESFLLKSGWHFVWFSDHKDYNMGGHLNWRPKKVLIRWHLIFINWKN